MWLLLAFLSATLLGLYDVSKKHALRDNAVLPVLFINTLLCSLIFAPLIAGSAAGLIPSGSPLHVAPAPWDVHRWVLLKSAIVLASWLCGYFAIKHLPLTLAGPINATRPVMTLTGAMLVYGERLNAWQWAGTALALLSLFLLSRSSRSEGIRFGHNRWVALLFAAALLGAASGLYDKFLMSAPSAGGLGLPRLAVQGWYNVYQCAMMLAMTLLLWWPRRHAGTPFRWRWSIVLISLFLTAADLAYFHALSLPSAMISIVSMARRASVVVSFACAALLFRERNLRAKALDLLLILLGMLCLAIGTTR